VGVLGLIDGQDHLLRLEGDLGDPAGREAVRLAVRTDHPCDVEPVRDGFEDLAPYLIFQRILLLPNSTSTEFSGKAGTPPVAKL
jgi:hypothetical protein